MQLTWRAATDEDLPRLCELHEDVERLLGKKMDMPKPSDPQILLYMAAVDENDYIHGAFYHEKAIEMCFLGRDPRVTAMVIRDSEELFDISRDAGVHYMHCSVPKLEEMEPANEGLESTGFENRTEEFNHFVKDLR